MGGKKKSIERIFVIEKSHDQALNRHAKKTGQSRSQIIRTLIENNLDM